MLSSITKFLGFSDTSKSHFFDVELQLAELMIRMPKKTTLYWILRSSKSRKVGVIYKKYPASNSVLVWNEFFSLKNQELSFNRNGQIVAGKLTFELRDSIANDKLVGTMSFDIATLFHALGGFKGCFKLFECLDPEACAFLTIKMRLRNRALAANFAQTECITGFSSFEEITKGAVTKLQQQIVIKDNELLKMHTELRTLRLEVAKLFKINNEDDEKENNLLLNAIDTVETVSGAEEPQFTQSKKNSYSSPSLAEVEIQLIEAKVRIAELMTERDTLLQRVNKLSEHIKLKKSSRSGMRSLLY